ncbi:MAG TPA: protein kinase, partial [Gemmatimonadaceae bacterium]|nr:protein kinase [Gemmatimonadaceae bacterium]
MSRVFVATEAGLGRRIVIKMLAPELAAGLSAERFEREIKLAASLQQANIVPVLAAGGASGFPYYTMPFVDGRSLRDRIDRDGALPLDEAVSILRDVARALAYAHERGVVHRDIKPANVLLSGGTAVVTDFGIAKALGAARPGNDGTLTLTGIGLGTPGYMAPEQAAGDPGVDHRADLYSLGCLAYEVLTGKPPFYGGPAHRIIASHFQETPAPVTTRRIDAPPLLSALVAACLEKDPSRRPRSAAEILIALDAAGHRHGDSSLARRSPAWLIGALAAVVAGVAAFAFRDRPKSAPVDQAGFAVVPFRNVAGDAALDYRSDGISDELLTAMEGVPGVRITGRTAAYRYKDSSSIDVQRVARELGARFVVTGTLQERNGRLVVSAQLNDSMAQGELWAARYDRGTKDIGSLADEIAATISDTLRSRFGPAFRSAKRSGSPGTTNSEALDLYLVGQELVKRRGSGITQSVANFEHAIALDDRFARAYAALATALQYFPYYTGTSPADVRDRTINAARRALAIDSTLADAHVALASALLHSGERAQADSEFEKAITFEPNNFAAHFTYGRILVTYGLPARALDQLRHAGKIERVSPLVSGWLAYAFFLLGQLDSSRAEIARAVELDSTLLPVNNLAGLLSLESDDRAAAR